MIDKKTIKSALESMLYVWGEALDAKTAAEVFGIEWKAVEDMLCELKQEYEARNGGIRIQQFGNSFQLCTAPENREYLERLCNPVKEKKLSRSAMETLAIIAYKQPVTRGEIESIRGVKCGRMVEGLVQKGLVEELGRSEAIGRPILFGTTDLFLRYFGIESLEGLPELEAEDLLEEENGGNGLEQLSFASPIVLKETNAGADEMSDEKDCEISQDTPQI